mgnify:CR=1 FL=1
MSSFICTGCSRDLQTNEFVLVPIDLKVRYFCYDCIREVVKLFFETLSEKTTG